MLKKGDKVKVLYPIGSLKGADIYTVQEVNVVGRDTYVYTEELEDFFNGFFDWRFSLVERARTTRTSKTNTAPKQLKRGSLYKILRNKQKSIIARYRNPAFEETLTFTVHDRPIFVKKRNVMVATKEEVQEYLKGSK